MDYLLPRITLHEEWRLQMIKIPYFIDLQSAKELNRMITNFRYVRYQHGPFDKKLYSYTKLFFSNEKWYEKIVFSYLTDEEKTIINEALSSKPVNNGQELKRLSYETFPMKRLWATIRWTQWWNEEPVFFGQ